MKRKRLRSTEIYLTGTMEYLDVLYLLLLPSGLIPLFLMWRSGKKLPSTKKDKKDRNPVNRHLRHFDKYIRSKIGRKGIFLTEIYSGIAHALMPIGIFPFLKFSNFAIEMDQAFVQIGVFAVWLIIVLCASYYSFVAWSRFRRTRFR